MTTTRQVSLRAGHLLLALLLLFVACPPSRSQPVPIRSLRELPLPKELRLASRPAPQTVLAPYEQFTGGSLTDFQGSGLAFTPSGSWRIANGQASTGPYQADQLSELVSEPFRLDTTLADRARALMGFALYFDERYALETGYDVGSVYLQHELADQSWSPWTLLSQRTGQSPGSRLTYLSLRDPALWHRRVRVKFALQSDCSTQYTGWTLDNVTFRQIVTSPEIRTALLPMAPPVGAPPVGAPPVGAPPMVPLYQTPGQDLRDPFNNIKRLVIPALNRLQEHPCRLDVTFVVNGAYFKYNSLVQQDLPQLVNNNLDELAQLLQEARQTSCKRVRVLVAGGQQSNQSTGEPYNYYLVGAGQAGSNQHANLQQTDLADLKRKVAAKLAIEQGQNLIPPQNGAFILRSYLDTYYGAAPEPGVKRVIVVLNNSDEFENFDVTHGPVVTATQLRDQLQTKGVTLIVNTHPQLANRFGPGVLQQAAAQKYQDRDPKYMLLDLAAAAACTPQDESCQDPGRVAIKLFGTEDDRDDNVTIGGILPGVIEVERPGGELELSSAYDNLLFSTGLSETGGLENPQPTLRVPLTKTQLRFYVTTSQPGYAFGADGHYPVNMEAKVYAGTYAGTGRGRRPAGRVAGATSSSAESGGETVLASGQEDVTITNKLLLYRGVNFYSNLYAEAQQGRVTPRGWGQVGAHASPARHNITGTNFSIFTSWSLSYVVAADFALNTFNTYSGQSLKEGVIMQLEIDPEFTVKSPNAELPEQEVLVIGPIQATGTEPVKQSTFTIDPATVIESRDVIRARLNAIAYGEKWPAMPPATPCLFVAEKWGELLLNQSGIQAFLVAGDAETPLLNGGVNSWSTDAYGLICFNLGRSLGANERIKVVASHQSRPYEGTSTAKYPILYLDNNPDNIIIRHTAPGYAYSFEENYPIPDGINKELNLGALVEISPKDVYGNKLNIDPQDKSKIIEKLDRVEFLMDGVVVPLWLNIAPERQVNPIVDGFYTTWTPTENRTYVFKPRAYLKDGTVLEDHKPLKIHILPADPNARPRPVALRSTAGQPLRESPLLEVYPNPVGGSFTLAYELPQADEVSVLLQPINGSRALSLLKGQKQAAGWQQLTVRSEGVTAGLYLLIVRGKHGYEQRHKLVKLP
ncbi:hypothetical protein IC235_21440 [Hymenobacter sp. BT664]|uniref:T9SS type A sorting domain-containing protein n=1 Tax=Hymenobacter montanus TaxID=2771359 RepID=A0A927GLC7_9BACT|nr:hypothetical protein [Hymenobacter montanus]MBD2770457.1 hypothetical protein [Hymenobacter montanus]